MSAHAKEVMKDKDVRKLPIHYPFWFGGSASCFAACVTHPLDLSMFLNYIYPLGGAEADVLNSQGSLRH